MTKPSLLKSLAKWGQRLETGLLVLFLSALILLAAAQIFMRNVLNIGIPTGDELLRNLVLWLAILGGLAASREERHISIDVITRYLSPKLASAAMLVVSIFVAGVCGFIAQASFVLVKDAYDYHDTVLGGQPAWIVQLILPVGFALMSWRYLTHSLRYARILFTGVKPDATG